MLLFHEHLIFNRIRGNIFCRDFYFVFRGYIFRLAIVAKLSDLVSSFQWFVVFQLMSVELRSVKYSHGKHSHNRARQFVVYVIHQ